jgi:hypothetical protein
MIKLEKSTIDLRWFQEQRREQVLPLSILHEDNHLGKK